MALTICVDVATAFFPSARPTHTHTLGPVSPHVSLAIHAALGAFVALECVTVVFYWVGRGWARWFVLVGCIYYLTGLKDVHSLWSHSRFTAIFATLDGVLAVFLLWYLHWTDVCLWFHERSIREVTNK